MFPTKVVERIKTHFVFRHFFFENRAFYNIMWEIIVERACYRWIYNACALRVDT